MLFGLLVQGLAYAQDENSAAEEPGYAETPPRLGFIEGQATFWRAGVSDWEEARVNTPIAPGDQFYTGHPGNLEVQIGGQAFLYAGATTQFALENLDPDLIQFKVTEGQISVDIHTDADPAQTVEIDTPNAVFLFESPGYYRLNVDAEHTGVSVYWSGRATVTTASGETAVLSQDEAVDLDGAANPEIRTSRAPEPDRWDQWCLAFSDSLLHSKSSHYLSRDIYGAKDLDAAGRWQDDPDYGWIWIPTGVPAGWVPYSEGSWIKDPIYGWTWVDAEPWGWAPFHYGRWVTVDGQWAWAPGPPVSGQVYTPAVVAFFDTQDSDGGEPGPVIGWIPLGWGEPLIPWWGEDRRHHLWWGGWGGPRLTEVEHGENYHNIRKGMVAVTKRRFGQGPINAHRVHLPATVSGFRPMYSGPPVPPGGIGFLPTAEKGIRPPDSVVERSVVATRQPHRHVESSSGRRFVSPTGRALPTPRLVPWVKRHFQQNRIEEKASVSTGRIPQPPAGPSRSGQAILHRQHEEPGSVGAHPERRGQIEKTQIEKEPSGQEQIRQEQGRQQQMQMERSRQEQIRQQQVQMERSRQEQIRQQQVQMERSRQEKTRQQQMQMERGRQEQIRQEQTKQRQIQKEQSPHEKFLQEKNRQKLKEEGQSMQGQGR